MNDVSLERLGIHNADHREEIWRQITKLRLKADILEMKDMERRSDLNSQLNSNFTFRTGALQFVWTEHQK